MKATEKLLRKHPYTIKYYLHFMFYLHLYNYYNNDNNKKKDRVYD